MAGVLTWSRSGGVQLVTTTQNSIFLGTVNAGQTLRRIRGRWVATILANAADSPSSILAQELGVGICTVTAGDQVPAAITQSGNQNDPLERWLTWRIARFTVPYPCGNVGVPRTAWQTNEPSADLDIESQVLNTNVTKQLNIYLSYQAGINWQTDWSVTLGYWVSILTG